jgi:hypothetical protein
MSSGAFTTSVGMTLETLMGISFCQILFQILGLRYPRTVTGRRRRLYESDLPIACDLGYSRHTVNRKLKENDQFSRYCSTFR